MVKMLYGRGGIGFDEALARARAMGKKTLTVIPNGISVIVAK